MTQEKMKKIDDFAIKVAIAAVFVVPALVTVAVLG